MASADTCNKWSPAMKPWRNGFCGLFEAEMPCLAQACSEWLLIRSDFGNRPFRLNFSSWILNSWIEWPVLLAFLGTIKTSGRLFSEKFPQNNVRSECRCGDNCVTWHDLLPYGTFRLLKSANWILRYLYMWPAVRMLFGLKVVGSQCAAGTRGRYTYSFPGFSWYHSKSSPARSHSSIFRSTLSLSQQSQRSRQIKGRMSWLKASETCSLDLQERHASHGFWRREFRFRCGRP